MDLLDSVLRKAKAENFAEKFKANGINTTTLSLLTDEDLQLLDINNPDIRQEILKCIENLQIPKERKNELLIDQEYVVTVLHCIGQQLLLHYASLSYAMTVENLIICDVKLLPATRCLVNSIQGLEQKLNTLEELVHPRKKSSSKTNVVLGVVTTVPLGLFILYKYINRLK